MIGFGFSVQIWGQSPHPMRNGNPSHDLRHYPVPLSASREGSNDNATTNGMARRG
jgi:hypothetical protein